MIELVKQLWTQYQGDIMMFLGALVAAYIPFKDKVNGYASKIWGLISTQKPTPKSDDMLDLFSIHDIVGILIRDRQEVRDEGGVELIVAFGKHLYDFDKTYVEEEEDLEDDKE